MTGAALAALLSLAAPAAAGPEGQDIPELRLNTGMDTASVEFFREGEAWAGRRRGRLQFKLYKMFDGNPLLSTMRPARHDFIAERSGAKVYRAERDAYWVDHTVPFLLEPGRASDRFIRKFLRGFIPKTEFADPRPELVALSPRVWGSLRCGEAILRWPPEVRDALGSAFLLLAAGYAGERTPGEYRAYRRCYDERERAALAPLPRKRTREYCEIPEQAAALALADYLSIGNSTERILELDAVMTAPGVAGERAKRPCDALSGGRAVEAP